MAREGGAEEQRTGRIRANYQFAKLALRSAAGADGSRVASYLGAAGGKDTHESSVTMALLNEVLIPGNCHLLCRPGVGISEFA